MSIQIKKIQFQNNMNSTNQISLGTNNNLLGMSQPSTPSKTTRSNTMMEVDSRRPHSESDTTMKVSMTYEEILKTCKTSRDWREMAEYNGKTIINNRLLCTRRPRI